MRKFAEMVIKYRIGIILTSLILTGFLGYQLKNLRVDSDILNYLPQNDPIVILFNQVGDQFGGNSLVMVGLETKDVFNHKTLKRINSLTSKFKEIKGMSHVMSLTDILDIKQIEGGLEVGKLIDKDDIPKNPETLKKLREYTLSKDMYRGKMVSADGRVTLIICRIKEGADKLQIGTRIKEIVKEENIPEKIYYAGVPFQMMSISDSVVGDLKFLIPIASGLLLFTLYLGFRNLRGVILPLVTVGVSTIWTLGLMSMLGFSLTVISDIIPVILLAVGSAYGIHMIAKFDEEIGKGGEPIERLKEAISRVGLPIVLAGVTTLIGFLSFVLGSYLRMIREFGIFTALGVFLAMVVSITLLPAILSLIRSPKRQVSDQKETTIFTRCMDRLGGAVLRQEKAILAAAVAFVIIALVGIPRIEREVNMLEYFAKKSDVRISEGMMEERFGGSIPIQVSIKGDLKNPFVLKEMMRFEKFLKTLPYVSKPQSIADLICEMNRVMNNHYTIPETSEGVANLWFFLEGNEVMDQLVDKKSKWGLIQANLGTLNTKEIIGVVGQIDSFLKREFRGDLVEVELTGTSEALRKEVKRQRTERILELIKWDIKAKDPDYRLDDKAIRDRIYSGFLIKSPVFSPGLLDGLCVKIEDYFKGGEADIKIKSEDKIKEIAFGIKEMTKTEYSQDMVAHLLKAKIGEGMDEKDISYTAESLIVLMDEAKEMAKVEGLKGEILQLLPDHLRDEGKFSEDLRDNLWEINEPIAAISLKDYSRITGQEEDPIRIAASQTGLPLIFKQLDISLLRSQITSLLIALFLVFILIIFLLKSFTGGLIGVVPIIITILASFSAMAYLSIPLDMATVMVGGIAIGIGIDYTIHFLCRFKTEFARDKSELEALDKTLETTGRAILINASSVTMGFLALLLSSLVPLQRFGQLTAMTMIVSAIGAITILPALILIARASFIGDFSRFNQLKNHILKRGGEK